MRFLWTIVLLVGILESPCQATRRKVTFSDNNLLTCNVVGKDGRIREESRYRVPLVPQPSGQVWKPKSSPYLDTMALRQPLDVRALMQFLISGGDFQQAELQYIGTNPNVEPGDGPFLPALLNRPEDPFPRPRSAPEIMFDPADDPDEIDAVRSYLESRRIGQCQLTPIWVRLSDDFFPYWYSATACLNFMNVSSCSFPEGLSCEPDVSTTNRIAYLTVLRWDCCFTVDKSFTRRFECGWRRVDIPIVVDCLCGCQPKLR